MRFALPILSLALFCAALPADAQTSRQRLSAVKSANLDRLHRLHDSIKRIYDDKDEVLNLSVGGSYTRLDAGGAEGTTPLALSYKAKDSSFTWGFETDGFAWKKPDGLAYQSDLSEARIRGDYKLAKGADSIKLGYGFGMTPKGDNGERDYTHSIHAKLATKLGRLQPNLDVNRKWKNGDAPGIWKRSTVLYLGVDYTTEREHEWSAGFTRQIADGVTSINAVEGSYTRMIAKGEGSPLTLAISLSLDLKKDEESKTLQLVLAKQF